MNNTTLTKAVRETRNARAEIVRAANKRTPQEQLAHLDKLGLTAAKERAKIAKKQQKVRNVSTSTSEPKHD